MITGNRVILGQGNYTGQNYAYVSIRDVDEVSIHLDHPNVGSISVSVSNEAGPSDDITNQIAMNAKSWAPLDLIDPSTGSTVTSVDLSTVTASSNMIKLGCLCYEFLRLELNASGGAYRAICTTARRAD